MTFRKEKLCQKSTYSLMTLVQMLYKRKKVPNFKYVWEVFRPRQILFWQPPPAAIFAGFFFICSMSEKFRFGTLYAKGTVGYSVCIYSQKYVIFKCFFIYCWLDSSLHLLPYVFSWNNTTAQNWANPRVACTPWNNVLESLDVNLKRSLVVQVLLRDSA